VGRLADHLEEGVCATSPCSATITVDDLGPDAGFGWATG
jgi:hypothetical protein